MLDIILRFYNDMTNFNPSEPIWVTYDDIKHVLTYRQINYMCSVPYISHMILPGRMTIGILNQKSYSTLMSQLYSMIESGILDNRRLIIAPKKMGFKVYHSVFGVPGPQLIQDVDLVSIKNPLIAGFVMKRYSHESRTLYKILKNERKSKSKGNK